MKNMFDFIFSLIFIIIIFPVFLIISLLIKKYSNGPVFFRQKRVGLNEKIFEVWKFRTMNISNEDEQNNLSAVSSNRIYKFGKILRKTKLDELPQLINILKGEMSFVGPRPELEKYVELYNEYEKKQIFSVKPGITDIASIFFSNEEDLLNKSNDPEKKYITYILPKKISLQIEYVKNRSLILDIWIILKTLKKILFK